MGRKALDINMKQKINGLKASGNGSYTDNVGRTIYGDLKNKKAYIIDNESKRAYILMSNRLFLSISLGALVAYYVNVYVGLILGVLLVVGLEIYFRCYFLKQFDCVEDVDFPSKSNMQQVIERKSDANIVVLIITDIVLSVVLAINAKNVITSNDILSDANSLLIVVGSLAIIVFSLYMAITAAKVIAKRRS